MSDHKEEANNTEKIRTQTIETRGVPLETGSDKTEKESAGDATEDDSESSDES